MATKLTPQERAPRVQAVLELELQPGGQLHTLIDELLDRANEIALDVAGVPVGQGTLAHGWDDTDVQEHLGLELAEAYFSVAKAFAERATDVPRETVMG